MNFHLYKIILSRTALVALVSASSALSADLQKNQHLSRLISATAAGPIVDNNYKWHESGSMWNRVTNFGILGDDAYTERSPSCDYPGGSGNSYLYRGSLWLSGFVNGSFTCTKADDDEFSPLDSVHILKGDEALSDCDIWTTYYDVKTPLAPGHTPLGVQVKEKSYSWSASYAADFIMYEYTITNVGIDSDDDGYPDTDQTIDDFYFTMRLDGDVSKLTTWGAEDKFSNQDDITMANGWDWGDWINYVPEFAGYEDLFDQMPVDSSIVFMFDADNPEYDADNGQPNDFGNPDVDGKLQTPGFLGFRILKTVPEMPKHSFHQCNIYNDPGTDSETWDRMIGVPEYENILLINDAIFPYDYRGILTYGPYPQLAPGDSIVITTALCVGADPDSGSVYSLADMFKDFVVADFMLENDFSISSELFSPGAPTVDVSVFTENSVAKGVKIAWDTLAVQHQNFESYLVSKGAKTASGLVEWETIATFTDTSVSTPKSIAGETGASWPPPLNSAGQFEIVDTDVINGLVYHYSVQTKTKYVDFPIDFGVIQSNLTDAASYKVISPANLEATETLDRVKVVPNPYIGSASWNNPAPSSSFPWEHRILFTNLPGDAKIRIFTIDGDYVAEIEANQSVVMGESFDLSNASVAEWDVMTRNNQEAAPGIYLYVVTSKSLGNKTGRFVIIR